MMAFFLVLVPLLVLAWQAWQSLNALSAQAEQTNRSTLTDARRSETMTNIAVEMERSYRQYCVLDDPRLSSVYQSQHERYAQMLEAHAPVIVDVNLLQRLNDSLVALSALQCRNNAPDSEALHELELFATRTVRHGRNFSAEFQFEAIQRYVNLSYSTTWAFLLSLNHDSHRFGCLILETLNIMIIK